MFIKNSFFFIKEVSIFSSQVAKCGACIFVLLFTKSNLLLHFILFGFLFFHDLLLWLFFDKNRIFKLFFIYIYIIFSNY